MIKQKQSAERELQRGGDKTAEDDNAERDIGLHITPL